MDTDLDLPERHEEALFFTHRFVDGIGADQWDGATPCADWNVRELVNHVVSGNFWAAELAAGRTIEGVGNRLDGDVLGDDPSDAYVASAGAANAAFRVPGAMEAPCAVSYGPVPGSVYVGHRIIDVVVHGWDIAAATGQPDELPAELVEACWTILEPQRDALISTGVFGDDHEIAAGADRQTQLLQLLGRTR